MSLRVGGLIAIANFNSHLNEEVRNQLKCVKYHGQYRDTNVASLRDTDVVITTYHTLAADFASKRNNPLAEIHWYRIVLDEGELTLLKHIFPIR